MGLSVFIGKCSYSHQSCDLLNVYCMWQIWGTYLSHLTNKETEAQKLSNLLKSDRAVQEWGLRWSGSLSGSQDLALLPPTPSAGCLRLLPASTLALWTLENCTFQLVLAASRRLQKHFKLKKKQHHNFDDLTPNYVYSCGFLTVSKYQVAKLTHHQKAAQNDLFIPPSLTSLEE